MQDLIWNYSPQSEAQDEQRDSQSGNEGGDLKLANDLDDASGVSGRDKSRRQGGHGLEPRDGPFPRRRKLDGIPRVVVEELDYVRVLVGAAAFVAPSLDLGRDARRVQQQAEMGRPGMRLVGLGITFGLSGGDGGGGRLWR